MTWQSTYKKFLVHYYVGKNLDVKLCTRRKSLDLRRTASFPFKKCLNCKYQECEDSMPRDNFTIKDVDGKNKVIQEIIIHRGSHQDIIGWSFDA